MIKSSSETTFPFVICLVLRLVLLSDTLPSTYPPPLPPCPRTVININIYNISIKPHISGKFNFYCHLVWQRLISISKRAKFLFKQTLQKKKIRIKMENSRFVFFWFLQFFNRIKIFLLASPKNYSGQKFLLIFHYNLKILILTHYDAFKQNLIAS